MCVQGQGLTCGVGHWLPGCVSSPSLAPLEGLIFCWLLLRPFPEFRFRSSDPKGPPKAGVDECLNVFCCCNRGLILKEQQSDNGRRAVD